MRKLHFHGVLLLAVGLSVGLAVSRAETVDYGPLHRDSEGLLRSAAEITRALLEDDGKAARAGLDRLHEGCRQLKAEEREVYGAGMLTSDRGFHETLNRAREHAGAGEIEQAFDMFVWVQRGCRGCHTIGAERGLYPRPGAD